MAEEEKPFLSFYQKHKISPVRQDISDLEKHFARRSALYYHLGLVPGLLRGKDVIEFGPGGGYNSIYTASLEPRRYVLVDGNPTGLDSTKEKLSHFSMNSTSIEFIESDVQECKLEDKFDLVIAEGIIPLQINPKLFCQNISSFVKPQGVLIITTSDHVSLLSEVLRRVLANLYVSVEQSLEEKVSILLPIFEDHIRTLSGMSRLPEDWLIDTIIIPFSGSLFSLVDAIDSLESNFYFYRSSPNFVSDWRWYKDINTGNSSFNDFARECFLKNQHNFIDYRFSTPERKIQDNFELVTLCKSVYEYSKVFEDSNDTTLILEIEKVLLNIINNIKEHLPTTALALEEYIFVIKEYLKTDKLIKFNKFNSLFGRGMPYFTFIRK